MLYRLETYCLTLPNNIGLASSTNPTAVATAFVEAAKVLSVGVRLEVTEDSGELATEGTSEEDLLEVILSGINRRFLSGTFETDGKWVIQGQRFRSVMASSAASSTG